MRITLIVDAERLGRGPAALDDRTEAGAELLACVRGLGGRIRALHPGASDPALSAFFEIELPGTSAPQRAISDLLDCQGVTAAYAKPADEPP
ncbi:hypothetical protein [Nonomuraea rosea]|uniref:hypothetical protein n=1 Tax=Nonomuraea rosea TaxID=638574 RepID=UPI0031F03DC1